jgi:hypothetical protein
MKGVEGQGSIESGDSVELKNEGNWKITKRRNSKISIYYIMCIIGLNV